MNKQIKIPHHLLDLIVNANISDKEKISLLSYAWYMTLNEQQELEKSL